MHARKANTTEYKQTKQKRREKRNCPEQASERDGRIHYDMRAAPARSASKLSCLFCSVIQRIKPEAACKRIMESARVSDRH